jgi:hypothetical protein
MYINFIIIIKLVKYRDFTACIYVSYYTSSTEQAQWLYCSWVRSVIKEHTLYSEVSVFKNNFYNPKTMLFTSCIAHIFFSVYTGKVGAEVSLYFCIPM